MIASERQKYARGIWQKKSPAGRGSQLSLRDHLDDFLLHPVFGYIFLVIIMGLFFWAVYGIGNWLEEPLLAFFDGLTANILVTFCDSGGLSRSSLLARFRESRAGSRLCCHIWFLSWSGLGLLEDIGYLTRIAFLTDALMHRMGLHGKAIVPFILGYGCSVPAIMSTRIMEDKRDRFLSAALVTMVPCAARLSVIFGLGFFLSGTLGRAWAFISSISFIIAAVAKILTRFMPEDSPGLILEMPVYRMPTLRTVTAKAWFRIREFVVEAWPLLIAGSIMLAL